MIYVIQAGNGAYKIGYTKDAKTMKRRLSSLQTGANRKLKLLLTTEGGYEHEAGLHRLLEQYWVSGEWFDHGNWMDPLIDHAITLLSQHSAEFVLSHTADQIRAYCPIPGHGPIPYIRIGRGGERNPQQYAGKTLADMRR